MAVANRFRDLVQSRVACDPDFAAALLNLFGVISYLQREAGVTLHVAAAQG